MIRITHFVNPHQFYFRYDNTRRDYKKILELENKIKFFFLHVKPNPELYKVGKVVGLHYKRWNKWIRGRIERIINNEDEEEASYILWLEDYGFPVLTKQEDICIVDDLLQKRSNIILHGGLVNILPAETNTSDFDKWDETTCQHLRALLNMRNHITIHKVLTVNKHNWCHLKIHIPDKMQYFDASQYIVSLNYAKFVSPSTFREICTELRSTNPTIRTLIGNSENFRFNIETKFSQNVAGNDKSPIGDNSENSDWICEQEDLDKLKKKLEVDPNNKKIQPNPIMQNSVGVNQKTYSGTNKRKQNFKKQHQDTPFSQNDDRFMSSTPFPSNKNDSTYEYYDDDDDDDSKNESDQFFTFCVDFDSINNTTDFLSAVDDD